MQNYVKTDMPNEELSWEPVNWDALYNVPCENCNLQTTVYKLYEEQADKTVLIGFYDTEEELNKALESYEQQFPDREYSTEIENSFEA